MRTRAPTILLLAALAGTAVPATSFAAQPAVDAQGASAAAPPDPAAFDDRPVRSVIIRTGEGQPLSPEAETEARNNLRTAAGGPFRAATADDDARRLNRLGRFGRVSLYVQPLDDGSVDVVFEVELRPVVADIQVAGNTRLSDQDIAAQVEIPVGAPVDRFQIDRAARRIEDLYREKGYYLARVSVDESLLEQSGIVVYNIREGERVKITDIRFEGVEGELNLDTRVLRRQLQTKTAVILLRKGQIDESKLDTDVGTIIRVYREHGYLDVRADHQITFSPNGKEAIVSFLISEGPVYHLRSVKVEIDSGDRAPVFTPDQVAGLIDVKPGDVYSTKAMDEALESIRNAYGQMGYVDVDENPNAVRRFEQRDTQSPAVDMLVRVTEGQRYKTGEVLVVGNDITKSNVLRRDVQVSPERPLDTVALDRTRVQLRRLRLFDPAKTRLTIQPPDAYEPEYRDVLVEVDETQTGEFNIGGAVASDTGIIGRIALTQRNFDIADTPDSPGDFLSGRSFRGAGQTFNLEAQPGDRIQTYSISLSDPRLYDSDYSGSVGAFYRLREYDEYDERRIGASLGFGRRFGTRWRGNLSLRVESIELSDVAPDRPTDIFDVADENLLTSVGVSFTRTTLDSIYRPTKGSRTRVGVEQAGALGGEFTFTRFSAEHRAFFVVREDYLGRPTVLSASVEMGYIPQGRDETPTYERYYLGGQSFRGFDFRTVSPRGVRHDNGQPSDDPVGGTWLFFAGLELNQPIIQETFALVLFLDTGTVTFDPGFEDYRVSGGFGIRFYIPQLSPAPLAFDFGFPIVSQENDESRVFSFSLDLPF